MTVLYQAELRGHSLLVKLSEKGSRRLLYLDTLRALAKESDQAPLELLIKIHLAATRSSTASFHQIVVPKEHRSEVIKLMAATGRLSGDLPILKKEQEPLKLLPQLVLKDVSGSFANLVMDYGVGEVAFEDFAPMVAGRPRLKKEEQQWEKDLVEAGFGRKQMAGSFYYCPVDKVKSVLRFLLELGWKVADYRSKTVYLQTDLKIDIREEEGQIRVKAEACFGDKTAQATKAWVDLDEKSVGLVDKMPPVQGLIKKGHIGKILPLLENSVWDEALKRLAQGLQAGAVWEHSPVGSAFQGTLLPYQQRGVDWLSFLHRFGLGALLADEMGLGKTVQVLAFLSRLGKNLPILIVAPASLLFQWRQEIRRFIGEAPHITLMSYTQLRLSGEEREFHGIVLDESNAIKTASTQTAQAAYKLKGKFKIALSGTPVENRSEELYSQFHFLLPDLIDRSELKEAARIFILRRKKEEVALQLPEKIEQIVWVEMDEAQKTVYETYRQGATENRMAMLETILRLRQICCDPRLVGEQAESAKLQRLLQDLEEVREQGGKVLVFSQFTSMLQLIRKEYPDALYLDGSTSQEDRAEQVRLFQEGGSWLFLLSLKAGGVGLNLTQADYVFLFDPWWNDAVERQAIDRAHRIGRQNPVIARRYLTVSTLEEKMLQLKEKKQQTADDLLEGAGGWSEEDLLYLLR